MGASENNSNKDKGQQKASVAQQGQQKASLAQQGQQKASLALQGQQEASLAQQGQRKASAAEHQEEGSVGQKGEQEGSVGQTGQQEGNVAPKDAEIVPKAPVVHPTVSRHKKNVPIGQFVVTQHLLSVPNQAVKAAAKRKRMNGAIPANHQTAEDVGDADNKAIFENKHSCFWWIVDIQFFLPNYINHIWSFLPLSGGKHRFKERKDFQGNERWGNCQDQGSTFDAQKVEQQDMARKVCAQGCFLFGTD